MSQNIEAEIKRKKRFLYSYKNNKSRLLRLEEKLVLLEHRIESVKSPTLSGMPRGGVPVTLDDLLSDKELLQDRIKQLKSKCRLLKADILKEIDLLEDVRYSDVLELYFIECLSFDSISEDLGYSVRHILNLYKEAIIELVNISMTTV